MARYIVSPRNHHGFRYPATESDMRALFGVTGPKWPDAGCPARLIQGIWVHVLPINHEHLRKQIDPRTGRARKSSKHRCIAACPDCGKAVSAGRLQQHKCDPLTRYRTPEDAELYGADADQIARDRKQEDRP